MRRHLLVDVHNHIYLPRYASLLRSRTNVPKIRTQVLPSGESDERLVILDGEAETGRPVGPRYWDRNEKLKFMNNHGIDISVVSPANPWLDFLDAKEAISNAELLNQDLEEYCATSPSLPDSSHAIKRLYGFGLLPLVSGATTGALLKEIQGISKLPHIKGIIMGTRGLGKGLDDPELEPMWSELSKEKLVVFLHPHYGVGDQYGDRDNGHVLPLALGFPMETTIAITRLILAGVYDRYPGLRILLAHSGGVLPQLSSRLASCIHHDPVVSSRLKHDARYYLGKLWYDAVAYGSEELAFVSKVGERAMSMEPEAGGLKRGTSRILFGTDYPFFPPLKEQDSVWRSVTENLDSIAQVETWSDEDKVAVCGANALELFGIGA